MALTYKTTIVTTTPYTPTENDEVLFVNVSGPASIVLPLIIGSEEDKRAYYIKDISGNATVNPITISAPGNVLVDGTVFALLNNGYSHVQVIYDGTNWDIIA